MFAYYIILIYASISIHTDVWQICIDSVIGIVCRFYVNPDSKYLHVRFVIFSGSNAFILHAIYMIAPVFYDLIPKHWQSKT